MWSLTTRKRTLQSYTPTNDCNGCIAGHLIPWSDNRTAESPGRHGRPDVATRVHRAPYGHVWALLATTMDQHNVRTPKHDRV